MKLGYGNVVGTFGHNRGGHWYRNPLLPEDRLPTILPNFEVYLVVFPSIPLTESAVLQQPMHQGYSPF